MLYQCSAVICDVLVPEQSNFLHHRLTTRPLVLLFPLSPILKVRCLPTRTVAGTDWGQGQLGG